MISFRFLLINHWRGTTGPFFGSNGYNSSREARGRNPENDFTFWYNDGDRFFGHSIVPKVTLIRELQGADIAGQFGRDCCWIF
jgi:hypothetical protein